MGNNTSHEAPKTLNKDQLYRMRHPDRIKATYARHYEKHAAVINERRRLKRQLFKEAVTRGFDQQNTTESPQDVDVFRDAPCTDAVAPNHRVD